TLSLPGSRPLALAPCGAGCYRGVARMHGGERALLLLADNGRRTRTPLVLPSVHAPSAAKLVAEVTRRYDGLRSVAIDEALSSGLSGTFRTHYELVAPTSFSYRLAN